MLLKKVREYQLLQGQYLNRCGFQLHFVAVSHTANQNETTRHKCMQKTLKIYIFRLKQKKMKTDS